MKRILFSLVIVFMLVILGMNTGAIEALTKLYDYLGVGKDDEKKLEKLEKSRKKLETIITSRTDQIKEIDKQRVALEASIAAHEKELTELTKPQPDPIVESKPEE